MPGRRAVRSLRFIRPLFTEHREHRQSAAVSLTRRPPISSGLQRPVRGRTLQHSSIDSLRASRLYPQIKGPYFPSRFPQHVRHEHGARSLCGRAQSVEENRHARRARLARRACLLRWSRSVLLINHGPAAEGTFARRAKGTRLPECADFQRCNATARRVSVPTGGPS